MKTKEQLLKNKQCLKAFRRISPFIIATGLTHHLGNALVPENLKNFGKYDILYTESCTHYDFFGDTYTTEGHQMLNVDTPQKSYFTYYYNINSKTNECD